MIPVQFDYATPDLLDTAIELLNQQENAYPLGGGYRLISAIQQGQIEPSLLINLRKLPNLQGIVFQEEGTLQINALTTYTEIVESISIKENYPLLVEAIIGIADAQIRNWETLTDIFAYQDLACDVPAITLVLEAQFHLRGTEGDRLVSAEDFLTTCVQQQWHIPEILTAILLPPIQSGSGGAYEAFRHPASRYTLCGIAVVVEVNNDTITQCRVAVTGATSHPQRLSEVESSLVGKSPTIENLATAAKLATVTGQGLSLQGDRYASAEYRAHLMGVLTQRALSRAVERSDS